jgi:hypothetical protein
MKIVLAFSLIAAAASAADLVWPADYWQSVTNRMNAVAPAGNAVKESLGLAEFDSRPFASSYDGMDDEGEVFDSRPYGRGDSNGINMVSLPPGLAIVVR